MRFLATVVAAALTLAGVSAQTSTGVLVGTVRDGEGGVIPGATIFALAGGSRWQIHSDAAGRYRLEVPAGVYRVEVQLAGFRRTTIEPVVVPPAKEVQRDFTMHVGILSHADYVLPSSLAKVVPQAHVIAHLRVVRSSETQLIGTEMNVLGVEHEVVVLTVVKGGQLGVKPGPARFLQENAGVWIEEGRQHIGENRAYKAGDEFVALLRRESDGRLREFSGRHLTFPVASGRVSQQGGPIPGFTNGITLEDFLEVLRKLS